MDSRYSQVEQSFQSSRRDVVIPSNNILVPQPNDSYVIRRGILRAEAVLSTPDGTVCIQLDAIGRGGIIFGLGLLGLDVQTDCVVRYHSETEVTLFPLTNKVLPQDQQKWETFFHSLVKAKSQQVHKLRELASHVIHDAQDLGHEHARLQVELRRAKASAVDARKNLAIAFQMLTDMRTEQERQSDDVLRVVNAVLQQRGHQPMTHAALLDAVGNMPPSTPEGHRPRQITLTSECVPPPTLATDDDIAEDSTRTLDWGVQH